MTHGNNAMLMTDGQQIETGVRSTPLLRHIARLVLIVLLNAVIWPSWAVAIEVENQKQQEEERRWDIENAELHKVLGNLQSHIEERKQKINQRINDSSGFVAQVMGIIGLGEDAIQDDVGEKFQQRLQSLREGVIDSLDAEQTWLQEKQLPEKIMQRHLETREKILSRYAEVTTNLESLVSTDQSLEEQAEYAETLNNILESFTTKKARDHFDPNNLPWGTPDPKTTPEPASTANDLSSRYGLPLYEQGVQLASNIITPDMLGNPGGPNQEHLNATIDAQISEAITAKAEELNHDPVEIYQWVRNNIEFIPSYGSIQGADYTLEYQRGNAFDTASLLIALLRASNIPARYAFGSVKMPADKVMNWVGNAKTPEAAGNLIGQGGIPAKGLVSGGKISHFLLEHVWVEAWIDYFPSRGAKHKTGDSWIPMDASFKQYDYKEGLNLAEQVPFDAESLVTSIEQNTTINEDEGWVQNLPQQNIEDALTAYQTQLEDYITNQNPQATVGEVLGASDIKAVVYESLAASLPYNLVTRKLTSASLKDSQRWKFKFELSGSYYGRTNGTYFSVSKPTVELAGKALSLSYSPATEDDEAVIVSKLPEPDENGEINPEDIPNTLPGYLINLIGEFKIGDEVVATTTAMSMGTELITDTGYWEPNRGWRMSRNEPIAGEYQAYALDLQGIAPEQAEKLKQNLEATQENIETENYDALTKQGLVGNTLYATILSYMALNNLQDSIQSKSAGMITYRAPSYGQFKTKVTPQYWYGVPRNVELGGLTMDVDLMMNYQVDESNDYDKFLAYNQAQGARMSAMEHLVPEQMFSSDVDSARGISAVKALQIAGAEGQKIWTITSANVDVAVNNLKLPAEIISEIRNSAAVGMEITAHEQPVNFYGSNQVGYVILDPQTGAGAYKIGGGESGGELNVESKEISITALLLAGSPQEDRSITEEEILMIGILLDKFSNWGLSLFEKIDCIVGVVKDYSDQLFFAASAVGTLALGKKNLKPNVRQFLKKYKLASYLIAVYSISVVAVETALCLVDKGR
ncbi:MAG: transglutaminase-like domain-containing protein [Oleibacter sp.]|nr:transglutaminase-like domain-containing protein [Thalassolituus sp.]